MAADLQGFLAEFIPRWLAAWNSHDTQAVLACMTDDVVVDDTVWPQQMRGHEEVREFLEVCWRVTPDLTFEFEEPHVAAFGEAKAGYYWRARASVVGDDDTSDPVELEGCQFEEYSDGKIARLRSVFDPRPIGSLLPRRS